MSTLGLVSVMLIALSTAYGLDNGLARTPPMGWSSWNTFACDINETMIMEIADRMVDSGLAAAGYEYLNIDDCWVKCSDRDHLGNCNNADEGRDSHGVLIPDPVRFPSGMKALADYVHSKGLKFGIYSSSGPLTCSGFTGSWQTEPIDAKTFAEWDVDYMKLDCCNTSKAMKDIAYPAMSAALNHSGRAMVYSCDTDELFANPELAKESGEKPWTWGPSACNLWRTGPDMKDNWFHILINAGLNDEWWFGEKIAGFSGPGQWNDPDMLVVGMGALDDIKYTSHFSLWAIMAAPLIAGNDIRNMTAATLQILTAPEVIAVDQDILGIQGKKISGKSSEQVWVKPLHDGSMAFLLFNEGGHNATICVTADALGYPSTAVVKIRDLWARADLGTFTQQYCSTVGPTASLMVRAWVA